MANDAAKPRWLTVAEAWEKLQQSVPNTRPAVEPISLNKALGRTLAAAPSALINVPPADNSAMDGFALRYRDLPGPLPISQRIPAGSAPQPLAPGSAARIFTGSEIPPGADTVVMQENCRYDETQVSVEKPPQQGANIRPSGEDIAADQPLLAAGHRLRPQDLGLLAAAGIASVQVYRPLRVTVLTTGDELIPPGQPLEPGKIYESNSPMIAALLTRMGFQTDVLRAPDDLSATVELLQQAANNDAIISIGGVSVGEEDHVKNALNQLGETAFWKIGLKPGKPFLLGAIHSSDMHSSDIPSTTPLLGLPGNPVSAFITFALFCKPFLNALQGGTFTIPRHWRAKAGFQLDRPNPRQQYLRATLAMGENGHSSVKLLPGQSSAMQTSLCNAEVLAVIPPETRVEEGQEIAVISLTELTG